MAEQNSKTLLKRNYYDVSIAELKQDMQKINDRYSSASEEERKSSEEQARDLLNDYLAKKSFKKHVSDSNAIAYFSGLVPIVDSFANALGCNVCMEIFGDHTGTVKLTSDIFLLDSNSKQRLDLTTLIFLSDFFEISADEDDTEVINMLFTFNLTKEVDE